MPSAHAQLAERLFDLISFSDVRRVDVWPVVVCVWFRGCACVNASTTHANTVFITGAGIWPCFATDAL